MASAKRIWKEGEELPEIGIDFKDAHAIAECIYLDTHVWIGVLDLKTIQVYRDYHILKFWRYNCIFLEYRNHEAVYLIANSQGKFPTQKGLGHYMPDSLKHAKQIIDLEIETSSKEISP